MQHKLEDPLLSDPVAQNDDAVSLWKNKLKQVIQKSAAASGSTTVAFDKDSDLTEKTTLAFSKMQLKLFKAQSKRKSEDFHKKYEPSDWHPCFIDQYDNFKAIEDSLIYLRARFKRHWDRVLACSFIDIPTSRVQIDQKLSFVSADDPRCHAVIQLWMGVSLQLDGLDVSQLSQEDGCIIALSLEMIAEQIEFFSSLLDRSKQSNLMYHEMIGIMTTVIAILLDNQPFIHPSADGLLIPKWISLMYDSPSSPKTAISKVGYGNKGSDAAILALKSLHLDQYIHASGMPHLPGLPLRQVGQRKKNIPVCGYFEWSSGALKTGPLEKSKAVLLSRTSETVYDLRDGMEEIITTIEAWVNRDQETKTLVFDTSLPKPREELWGGLGSQSIQKLIHENRLQVIVVTSDQKQQALGTGKLASGEYCVIGAKETIEHVNQFMAASPTNIDTKVTQFFRQHTQESRDHLMTKQTENARLFAELLGDLFSFLDVRSNGPFVLIIDRVHGASSEALKCLMEAIGPKSYSFGFVDTSYSRWDASKLRVSVGLDDPVALTERIKSLPATQDLLLEQPLISFSLT